MSIISETRKWNVTLVPGALHTVGYPVTHAFHLHLWCERCGEPRNCFEWLNASKYNWSLCDLIADWKIILNRSFRDGNYRLSACPDKNKTRQVKILDTFPKDRLKFLEITVVCLSRTGKNRAGQVSFFQHFSKGKAEIFCNFHPCIFPWKHHAQPNRSIPILLDTWIFFITEEASLSITFYTVQHFTPDPGPLYILVLLSTKLKYKDRFHLIWIGHWDSADNQWICAHTTLLSYSLIIIVQPTHQCE